MHDGVGGLFGLLFDGTGLEMLAVKGDTGDMYVRDLARVWRRSVMVHTEDAEMPADIDVR